MNNHMHCFACSSVHSFLSKTVNCWNVLLFTLCRASTCRSWKREVSSLMAWLARITDRTPNPWCLEENRKCHLQKVPPAVISWHSLRLNHIHKNIYLLMSDSPFARTKFWRSCAILGACSNISDTKGSKRIFLFPFICKCCGAQVQNQVQAVQKTPGSEQLEVLIMLKK